jgi:hypothetical protein
LRRWDEAWVAALAAGDDEAVARLVADVPAAADQPATAIGHHSGKYAPLTAWLASQTVDEIEVSFGTIEELLGFRLPASSRRHGTHWHSIHASAVARAITAAGRRSSRVDLTGERLVPIRPS